MPELVFEIFTVNHSHYGLSLVNLFPYASSQYDFTIQVC